MVMLFFSEQWHLLGEAVNQQVYQLFIYEDGMQR